MRQRTGPLSHINTLSSVSWGPPDESEGIISTTGKLTMGWRDLDSKDSQRKNGFGVATSRELSNTKTATAVPRWLQNHVLSYLSLRKTFDSGELREKNKSVGLLSEEHNRQKSRTPHNSKSEASKSNDIQSKQLIKLKSGIRTSDQTSCPWAKIAKWLRQVLYSKVSKGTHFNIV